jgi:hypothetical protein
MAVWFRSGLNKGPTFRAGLKDLGILCGSRDTARRGLNALQKAGLVIVTRTAGQKPEITVLAGAGVEGRHPQWAVGQSKEERASAATDPSGALNLET